MNKKTVSVLLAPLFALAASQLACQAGPLTRFLASTTPTPTATPTSTLTPTATLTPQATSTPLPLGVQIEKLTDGSLSFTDLDNHYHATFSKAWLPILISQKNTLFSPAGLEQDHPEYLSLAANLKDMDAGFLRLVSVEAEPKYAQAKYPTIVSVMIFSDIDPILKSLGMAALTAWIEDHPLQGTDNLDWDVKTNAHGVEIGINNASENMHTSSGNVVAYIHILSFLSPDNLVMIQVMTPEDLHTAIVPQLDGMIDSIELLNP